MNDDVLFRWFCVAILLGMISISTFYRRRARQSGPVIKRAEEGTVTVLVRLTVAAPLFLSMIAYAVNPEWMRWSAVGMPVWLRWLGVACGLTGIPLIFWVMRTIGDNISETYLTKEDHSLVTSGPYRLVRHPLYAVAIFAFAAIGVIAANWFIIAMVSVALAGVYFYVIPREEAALTKKFGDAYRDYARTTGRLVPRRSRNSA